jgi:hypothetical protein
MGNHAQVEEDAGRSRGDAVIVNPKPPMRRISIHALKRRTTVAPIQDPVDHSSLFCGLVAGVAQAGIFNPYDRALYLSVKEDRPFFHPQNWKSPFTGFFQSLSSRALSGGLYFPLEHFFLRCMDPYESKAWHNLAAGTAAGAVNGCLLNPFSTIKYKTWGQTGNPGMWHTAVGMIRQSGSLRPFSNGLVATVWRDVVFGGCYTWLRLQIQYWGDLSPQRQWMGNLTAAALATVASGPFNFARNIQYATSSRDIAASTCRVLLDLVHETRLNRGVVERWHFLQNRLRIGWGTARVACGMAFGHAVYDWLHARVSASSRKRER